FMPNLATKDPIGPKHIQPDPPVVEKYLANAGGGARRLTRPERVLAGRGNRISCSAVAAFFICSLILFVSLWVVTVASGAPGPSLWPAVVAGFPPHSSSAFSGRSLER